MKKFKKLFSDRPPETWEEWVVFASLVIAATLTFVGFAVLVTSFFIECPLALLLLLLPILWAFYKVLTNAND